MGPDLTQPYGSSPDYNSQVLMVPLVCHNFLTGPQLFFCFKCESWNLEASKKEWSISKFKHCQNPNYGKWWKTKTSSEWGKTADGSKHHSWMIVLWSTPFSILFVREEDIVFFSIFSYSYMFFFFSWVQVLIQILFEYELIIHYPYLMKTHPCKFEESEINLQL